MNRLVHIMNNPPPAFSPAPIWWWSGDPLEIDRLRWQMDRFLEGGVTNLVILNLAPTGPLYGSDPDEPRFFSEPWWDVFLDVCQYAADIGMSLWIYDQIGFSGANLQGEMVRQQPEFAGQWLESVSAEGLGELHVASPHNGEPLGAGAVPIDDEGRPVGAVVDVPVIDGRAQFQAKTPHRLRLAYTVRRGFDYFNVEACHLLLDTVHGEYERRARQFFGTSIVGSFQDELPSLPTWSPNFLQRFQARFGYDVAPSLIGLWEGDDAFVRQARVDVHRLRTEMAEAAIFKPLFEWHEKHGLTCGFDQQSPSRAGEPKATVEQYADYMTTHRWYDAPGSDHHGDAKIHSSMAHLYGRSRVWIEAFHSTGWGGTIAETMDWLLPWIRAGATLYNPHAVYYSTRGGWWEWAPPSTCWRQPYWRHYREFAHAIARLCAILSEGVHVCDIGVLFPTTTVQAGLTPSGSTAGADRAHRIYMELVGIMHWHRPKAGMLDQDARDYDVLDDASVQRGTVQDGALVIGEESYRVLVLPACQVLEAETARTLLQFVAAGGTLIAIGALPNHVMGEDGEALLADFVAAHRSGVFQLIGDTDELPGALAAFPRLVDAPVPTLLRRAGDATILFVPAAFPYATVQWVNEGQALDYEFDPDRYADVMRVTVRGVEGAPEWWNVLTGEKTPLPAVSVEGGVQVDIPFHGEPMALLVWSGKAISPEPPALTQSGPVSVSASAPVAAPVSAPTSVPVSTPTSPEKTVYTFPSPWSVTVEPTMDNRFGDFNKPNDRELVPVETWFLEHQVGTEEDDALHVVRDATTSAAVGHKADTGNQVATGSVADALTKTAIEPATEPATEGDTAKPWSEAHVTFGVYGRFSGPAEPSDLPPVGDMPSKELVYSLSRGIAGDRLHYQTLGPKGHVPEEFCRFGAIKQGQAVQVSTRVWIDDADLVAIGDVYFALAARTAKEVWVNGEKLDVADDGYLSMTPVQLKSGANVLTWRLTADGNHADLRSYWCLTTDPDNFRRPEWITIDDEPRRDSAITFSATVSVPFDPVEATVQLAADAPARIVVNGVEAGRQGGFDPYHVFERVQPYVVTGLKRGDNDVVVEVHDVGRPAAIMVDALVTGAQGEVYGFASDADWVVSRDDGPATPVHLRRRQWIDPAWSHLWRRAHPLPGAMWIEDETDVRPGQVLKVVPDAFLDARRVEWFRWVLPPGAEKAFIPAEGDVRLWIDGEEVSVKSADTTDLSSSGVDGERTVYAARLPKEKELHRVAVMKVKPRRGRTGGGVFTGPIRYTCGRGTLAAGDWRGQGLDSFSGSVVYEATFAISEALVGERLVVDAGQVRGSVEARVNGVPVGVKPWSPYRFDVSAAVKPGENRLELIVCNTLGPYMKAASPTPFVFPRQDSSGIFGPVTLIQLG